MENDKVIGSTHFPHGWLGVNANWGGVVLRLMQEYGNIIHY